MAMETRGNRQNYLALNDGYESDAPSEGCISSLLSPATQCPESRAYHLYLTPSVNRQSVQTSILCVEVPDDEVLPSKSASQPPVTATSSQIADPAPGNGFP
ncbi:hypothetical protein V1523DRAFT_425132 [Lipomyces doorenjongii]